MRPAWDDSAHYIASSRLSFANRMRQHLPVHVMALSMDDSPRAASAPTSTRLVDVLVPVALDQTYSYRVPRGMELKPGDLVAVPLGPREVLAVVWGENANPDPRLHNRLKDVIEKLDLPPLKPELRAVVDWVAGYTLGEIGRAHV